MLLRTGLRSHAKYSASGIDVFRAILGVPFHSDRRPASGRGQPYA